jgi:hypothetical protein
MTPIAGVRIIDLIKYASCPNFLVSCSNRCNFRKEDTVYKTAHTALLAGLVALTALSVSPLTASAGTLHGVYVGDSEHQKP